MKKALFYKNIVRFIKNGVCIKCIRYMSIANDIMVDNMNNIKLYGDNYSKTTLYKQNDLMVNWLRLKTEILIVLFRIKLPE